MASILTNSPPHAFMGVLLGGKGLLKNHHERQSQRQLMRAFAARRDLDYAVIRCEEWDAAVEFTRAHGFRAARRYARAIFRGLGVFY